MGCLARQPTRKTPDQTPLHAYGATCVKCGKQNHTAKACNGGKPEPNQINAIHYPKPRQPPGYSASKTRTQNSVQETPSPTTDQVQQTSPKWPRPTATRLSRSPCRTSNLTHTRPTGYKPPQDLLNAYGGSPTPREDLCALQCSEAHKPPLMQTPGPPGYNSPRGQHPICRRHRV